MRIDALDDDGTEAGALVQVNLDINDPVSMAGDSFETRIANVAPTLVAPTDREVECPATVDLGPVTFTDPGVLDTHTATVEWGDGTTEGLGDVTSGFSAVHLFDMPGTYTVRLTVVDDDGGSDTTTTTITVVDTTPPEVETSVGLGEMWPPNNKLVSVGFSQEVEDACDPEPTIVVKVYSDEADTGPHTPDARMNADGDLELRTQRLGQEDGRVYLIVVWGEDASGNHAFASTTVTVAHAQSARQVQDVRGPGSRRQGVHRRQRRRDPGGVRPARELHGPGVAHAERSHGTEGLRCIAPGAPPASARLPLSALEVPMQRTRTIALSLFAALFLALPATAAPEGWHTSLKDGVAAAEKSRKPILLITAWKRTL